jgi:hypothetical protein
VRHSGFRCCVRCASRPQQAEGAAPAGASVLVHAAPYQPPRSRGCSRRCPRATAPSRARTADPARGSRGPHTRTSLVTDALSTAHSRGLTAGNAIMHSDTGAANTSRGPTSGSSSVSTYGNPPAEQVRVSTAPPRNPSSPPSNPRPEPTPGPIEPAPDATSRTTSPTTTPDGYTPRSTTSLPPRYARRDCVGLCGWGRWFGN